MTEAPRGTEAPNETGTAEATDGATGAAANQYEAIGDKYRSFKDASTRESPEQAHVAELLGDVSGLRVLDLGCGHGHYTRYVKGLGAERVTGVDLSPEMVRLARESLPEDATGIDFRVGDAADLGAIGEFDVVMAVWLFPYTESVAALKGMMATVAGNLVPGGRLVAVTAHHSFDPERQDWEPHGLRVLSHTTLPRRHRMTAALLAPRGEIVVESSLWEEDVYAEAAREAGLSVPRWSVPDIPESSLRERGPEHWDVFRSNPFMAGLTARREPGAGA
ncbi:class I SAM-dependent methyltransferase [Streptomyces sp. NPDC002454]